MGIRPVFFLKKILFLSVFAFFSFAFCNEIKLPFPKWWEPEGLEIFRECYPDITFESSYDTDKNDWRLTLYKEASNGRKVKTVLYWCGARFLPEEKLSSKEDYRPMFYPYSRIVPDPKDFTPEYIEKIRDYTSRESRATDPIDSPFLYNFIYDCKSRETLESHIVKTDFLGFSLNVHERIKEPLKRVEKRINSLTMDDELSSFIKTLNRIDCYNWRSVRDTENRSFHSLGLAIDVLPNRYYQRSIYWGWQRQWDSETWWKTPLEKRWIPPDRIIDIFVEEGFIWGGSWIVWDNMHFEYRPELIKVNGIH